MDSTPTEDSCGAATEDTSTTQHTAVPDSDPDVSLDPNADPDMMFVEHRHERLAVLVGWQLPPLLEHACVVARLRQPPKQCGHISWRGCSSTGWAADVARLAGGRRCDGGGEVRLRS